MQAEVTSALWPYVSKALVGLIVTGLGALLMYPIRAIKKEWANLNKKIEAAQEELVQQRTNHLMHIEAAGAKQVELLGKACDTLEAIHLGQVEMSGYIKASIK